MKTNTSTSTSTSKRTTVSLSLLFQILILLSSSSMICQTHAIPEFDDIYSDSNTNTKTETNVDINRGGSGIGFGNGILAEKREQFMDFTNAFIVEPVKQQYDQLSPRGKFISTAFVGFTTSRVSVKTTVQIAKYTGAAFIISEVLNSAGILDGAKENLDDYNILDEDMVHKVKQKVTFKVNQCRLAVRERCSVEKIKNSFDLCLEKDRVGTLGFTTGAVAALIL